MLMFGGGLSVGATPTLILYGGTVVPMTNEDEVHEAIAIDGDSILAVGSSEEILLLAGGSTKLVNLDGRAVFPGFIDPHTHLFDGAGQQGMTLAEVQQMAVENGITTAANMHTTTRNIDNYISFAEGGGMRFRYYLYLTHTNSCGEIEGFWYEKYEPKAEIAPGLYMGGVKLFVERSVCRGGGIFGGAILNFSDELRQSLPEKGMEMWGNAWLIHTRDELAAILERVQLHGYQAAIHAIGDLAVETCLDAYEQVLDGQPNDLRHMILHNFFLRDDLLPRYSELGVVALVEMTSPQTTELYSGYVGEDNLKYLRRWADLVATGAHVAIDSDWSGFPISPIDKLRAFVGGENTDPGLASFGPCAERVPQTVTAWQAMRMMTVEPALALHVEEQLGTLERGKLADIVVLSESPLSIAPARLGELRIELTVIDGRIEWDSMGAS